MCRIDTIANIFQTYPTTVGVEYRKNVTEAFVQFEQGEQGLEGAKKLLFFINNNLQSPYHAAIDSKLTSPKRIKTVREKKLVGYKAVLIKELPANVVDYLGVMFGKNFEVELGNWVGNELYRTDRSNYKGIWGFGVPTGELKPFYVYLPNKYFAKAEELSHVFGTSIHDIVFYAVLKSLRYKENNGTIDITIRVRRSVSNQIHALPMGVPFSAPVKLWRMIEANVMSVSEIPTERAVDNYLSVTRVSNSDRFGDRTIRPPRDKWDALLHRYSESRLKKLLAFYATAYFSPPKSIETQPIQPLLFL